MVNKNRDHKGFMLLEAILAVVIVSICLTFLAQSLLTNFRTGIRFQEAVRSMMVMENQLGFIYASNASDEDLSTYPVALKTPYDKFKITNQVDTINDHLKKIALILNWPAGHKQGQLDVTTVVYIPDEIKN